MKKFNGSTAGVKSQELERAEDKIKELEIKQKELKTTSDSLQKKFDKIKKSKSDEVNDKHSGDRMPTIMLHSINLPSETLEKTKAQISHLWSDYEISKKQAELLSDIEQIKSLIIC